MSIIININGKIDLENISNNQLRKLVKIFNDNTYTTNEEGICVIENVIFNILLVFLVIFYQIMLLLSMVNFFILLPLISNNAFVNKTKILLKLSL